MFFKENTIRTVTQWLGKENSFSTELFETRLSNQYLITSKLVGTVENIIQIPEDSPLNKDDMLGSINYLGLIYTLRMEYDGCLKKTYVKDSMIIEYSSPLFLIEIVEH